MSRACCVVSSEIPTLPPMLRARLTMPVALFIRSLGPNANAVRLIGRNKNARKHKEQRTDGSEL